MENNTNIGENKESIVSWFKELQDDICLQLEALDGTAKFREDKWERPEGGGGRSRVIQGEHIEKGGVMFSHINGLMPEVVAKGIGIKSENFDATGVSIVLHPSNPWVPIIHMNVRYFQTESGIWWFGGGIDATPHYINEEEARIFHLKLKKVCDPLDALIYDKYKKWADDYFYNKHRNETRGIGGIFFDRMDTSSTGHSKEACWAFVRRVGNEFVSCYQDLFKPNFQRPYSDKNKSWQNVRRGRYVEFNLVYDRGTKFGLQTNGRIESILMSMPPNADWLYNHQPAVGSEEYDTLSKLNKNINWLTGRGA